MVMNTIKNIKINSINNYSLILSKFFLKNLDSRILQFNKILIKYKNICTNKINLLRNSEFFKNNNSLVMVVDLKTLRSKIVCFNKYKSLIFISNGIIFKKLQLNHKKYIKSEKLTYLIIKSAFIKMNFLRNYKNIIINIKGVKNNNNNIISYINKNISKNNLVIYLNNYSFSTNKYFKTKKIKAIKRKLKKKIIKYK